MEKKPKQRTSVVVDSTQFEEFKQNSVRYKFSLQKLVNRTMFLYNNDEEFRKKVHNTKLL